MALLVIAMNLKASGASRIILNESTIELEIEVDAGARYSIENSDNLADWKSLGTFVANSATEKIVFSKEERSADFFKIEPHSSEGMSSFLAGSLTSHEPYTNVQSNQYAGTISNDGNLYWVNLAGELSRLSSDGQVTKKALTGDFPPVSTWSSIESNASAQALVYYTNAGELIFVSKEGVVSMINKADLAAYTRVNGVNVWSMPSYYDNYNVRMFESGLVFKLQENEFALMPAQDGFLITDWAGNFKGVVFIEKMDSDGRLYTLSDMDGIFFLGSYLYAGVRIDEGIFHYSQSESDLYLAKINIGNGSRQFFPILTNKNDIEFIHVLFPLTGGIGIAGQQYTYSSMEGKDHGASSFFAKMNTNGSIEWIKYVGYEAGTSWSSFDAVAVEDDRTTLGNRATSSKQFYTITSDGQIKHEMFHRGNSTPRIVKSGSVVWIHHSGWIKSIRP